MVSRKVVAIGWLGFGSGYGEGVSLVGLVDEYL